MSTVVLGLADFLKKAELLPVLDVRSEKEFEQGHFPGAINLPILDNDSRVIVGTTYKQEGHEKAVIKGFELVGPKFAEMIKQANEIVPNKEVVIYCWRGGMRSNIMAWLLSMAGFKVNLLKGGYKTYRSFVLESFSIDKNILILGGLTGSGKTEVLLNLKSLGEQVIDLEGLANHKGSAFGALGKGEQPTNEQFENSLSLEWNKLSDEKVLWLENESRMIGSIKIPDQIFEKMRSAQVLEIETGRENRVNRIINDYGKFPIDVLKETTTKLKKRLGDLRHRQALSFLEEGLVREWVLMMLEYYDKFYVYGNEQRSEQRIKKIVLHDPSSIEDAEKVLQFVKC